MDVAERRRAPPCAPARRGDARAVAAAGLGDGGPLDLLVCAAGTNVPKRAGSSSSTPADWATLVDTNLSGVFHLVSACLPALRAARGLVILVGSVSGAWPDRSGPGYQAAKAGALAFARAAGLDEHEHGVRFSVVAPGSSTRRCSTAAPSRRPPPRTASGSSARRTWRSSCAFLAGLPARVHVPELTVLPTALQVLGRTG